MLALSRPRHFHVARVLRAGGADDKTPRWALPAKDYHKFTYQPTIPDKHFNIAHYNYAPITLWLRTRRPTLEKIGYAMYASARNGFLCIYSPCANYWDNRLPGFGYKCMGFLGLLIGYNLAVMYWLDRTEAFMMLEKLHLYRIGHALQAQGFFQTDAEDREHREHAVQHNAARLEALWETAITDATEKRSFETLVSYLPMNENAVTSVPEPISWRLSSMPYGRNNKDTKVFEFPAQDKRGDSNFQLDIGDVGDYIDRHDNKSSPLCLARNLYTSVYLAPTK